MFRKVELDDNVCGQLLLHSMLGRYESFGTAQMQIAEDGIGRVVCLAPMKEIQRKSPDYARAISESKLPWTHEFFDIPDYDAPQDREAFLKLSQGIANRLLSG